jgi:Glycosyl Hydrolase Family 88
MSGIRIRNRRRCSIAEILESRVLLSGSPLIINGVTGNNTFYLRENADHLHLDVWDDAPTPGSGTPTQSVLITTITTVTVNGKGTNDTITIDFSNGDPFPSTVAFTGGSGAGNSLIVTGIGGVISVNASTVTFGSTAITYASTQSITINGSSGNDTLTQTAQPGAFVAFNGGGGNDTLNINAGTYLFTGDPASAPTNLTVNDNAWLYFESGAALSGFNPRHLAALNIGASAQATVDAPPDAADRAVLVVGTLSINATGQLNLEGNDLIVHSPTMTNLQTALVSGDNSAIGGYWNGQGMDSAMASGDTTKLATLGLLLNAKSGTKIFSTFDGQTVTTTDALIKYADYGDANLSGNIDGSDYSLIDNGFGSHGSLTGWSNGDFNYDGHVDGSDYSLIDNAFNMQGTTIDPLSYTLENARDVAQLQMKKTIAAIGTSANYPQYTNPNGTWSWVSATHWTAGFLPGEMWELYQETGDPYYKTEATQFTQPLSVDDKDTSDVGFQVYDSFDPLLQQEPGNASIIQTMLTAAASKATQYNSTVGAFKAWRTSTSGNPAANFDVLMDLIMDSNLLFWAAKQSGNQTYYNEAVSNAIVEENYLVRPDGGSAQFAYFNSANGQFVDNETYEGYSASSTWSRGEAWGIYGFTMCYQQTGRADFLATAEKMANYFIANLPADHVPYWDFNDPAIPNTYRDSSAAAVAASGLMQLSQAIAKSDPTNSAKYRTAAGEILASLASPGYLANPANPGDGVLLQGALNVPANPSINDSAIVFGDYYFLEAADLYL